MRAQITAEARGRLRGLWSDLAGEAATIRRAVAAIPAPMARAAVRPGVGSTAAVDRIVSRLPLRLLTRGRRMAVWRFLEPTGEPEPPTVRCMAVLLGVAGRPALSIEPFGLTFAHHALGRLGDRTAWKVSLPAAMLDAHDHLAILPPVEGERLLALATLTVPAGPGAFLIQPRGRSADGVPDIFAKTWLSADQFTADQVRDVNGWARFVAASVPAA